MRRSIDDDNSKYIDWRPVMHTVKYRRKHDISTVASLIVSRARPSRCLSTKPLHVLPYCSPISDEASIRYPLHTGRQGYPPSTIRYAATGIAVDEETLPQVLRRAGFRTPLGSGTLVDINVLMGPSAISSSGEFQDVLVPRRGTVGRIILYVVLDWSHPPTIGWMSRTMTTV
jgi:hypothetical protein